MDSESSWCEIYCKIVQSKHDFSEAYFQRCFYKNVFLKYTAKLRENTHAEVQFQQSCKATLLKSHFCIGALI